MQTLINADFMSLTLCAYRGCLFSFKLEGYFPAESNKS